MLSGASHDGVFIDLMMSAIFQVLSLLNKDIVAANLDQELHYLRSNSNR